MILNESNGQNVSSKGNIFSAATKKRTSIHDGPLYDVAIDRMETLLFMMITLIRNVLPYNLQICQSIGFA